MIPKLILCSTGLYFYLICVFLQMSWIFYYKNTTNLGLRSAEIEGQGVDRNTFVSFQLLRNNAVSNKMANSTEVLENFQMCRFNRKFVNCTENCLNFNRRSNNSTHLYKATDLHQFPRTDNVVCNLENIVKNCSLLKDLHGYNTIPVSTDERLFPLAFAIKMHDRPNQAEQIIRTIYRPHNVYCIHVDARADKSTFDIINDIGQCFENIIVIQDRDSVIYSSYAHVTSEIKCMKAMMESNTPWKYYINLSGQEFPLKTNMEMVAILKFLDGTNDIETYDHPVFDNWKIENAFTLHKNSLAQDSAKPVFKYKMKFSKGNQFGLLSRDFVNFIFHDDVANDILNYFNDTYSPGENVWATLVTLPWAPGGYPVAIRHMISTYISRAMIVTGDTQKCHGRIVRGMCHFSCGDIAWLKNRHEFFASKFDSSHDETVLNCLEQWYRQKTTKPRAYNIDWNLYNRLPHLKYQRQNRYNIDKNWSNIKKEWLQNARTH